MAFRIPVRGLWSKSLTQWTFVDLLSGIGNCRLWNREIPGSNDIFRLIKYSEQEILSSLIFFIKYLLGKLAQKTVILSG